MPPFISNDVVPEISKSLKLSEAGLWISSQAEDISYPSGGHQMMFQIEDQSFWYKHRTSCVTEIFRKYPCPFFIDVGGGNGIISRDLAKNGYSPILLEPSLQGAMNAKQNGIDVIICSSLKNAEFFSESVPAVGIFDVLEHVSDQTSFLKEIFRILKQNGKLYLTVPAYPFLWSYHDVSAGHYRRYSLKSISEILIENGFKILYSSYYFSLLIIPMLIFRKKYKPEDIPSELFKQKIKEHQINNQWLSKLYKLTLAPEIFLINKHVKLPFGTSCIVVCEK